MVEENVGQMSGFWLQTQHTSLLLGVRALGVSLEGTRSGGSEWSEVGCVVLLTCAPSPPLRSTVTSARGILHLSVSASVGHDPVF